MQDSDPANRGPEMLADVFCRGARKRIRRLFADVFSNHDVVTYRLAQDILAGHYSWMETGIVDAPE